MDIHVGKEADLLNHIADISPEINVIEIPDIRAINFD